MTMALSVLVLIEMFNALNRQVLSDIVIMYECFIFVSGSPAFRIVEVSKSLCDVNLLDGVCVCFLLSTLANSLSPSSMYYV